MMVVVVVMLEKYQKSGEKVMELIYQGAEARLFRSNYLSKDVVIKERLRKSYRLPELDQKINKQRLLQEVRCNVKCRKAGVLTPTIFDVDLQNLSIIFEFISGVTVKEFISKTDDQKTLLKLAELIGSAIGRIHNADIVHGDLTTSNLMVIKDENINVNENENDNQADSENYRIVIIDFGLGMTRPVIEDKAVDLYVLERALVSTHPGSEYLTEAILVAYRRAWAKSEAVLQRLEQVRQRGRKRDMIG